MKRLSWLRSLITIGLLGFIGVQSGCAGWLPPLARTVLIDSRAALSGATHAMDTRELPLSDQAELYLYPRQLWLQGDSLVARAHEGRLRLQVIVRVIRADGGVIQWFVGARRDAPTSEGGFEVALEGDKATVDFGGMRLGPVRAADVIGLQLFVTLMPREPIQTVHFVGAAGEGG